MSESPRNGGQLPEGTAAAILDSIADGVYALDRESRFTHFNDSCERYFGLRREAVLGRTYGDVFPVAQGSVIETAFAAAFATGKSQSIELVSMITGIPVLLRAFPSEEGLTVVFTDVSERYEAERERARIEAERVRQLATFDAVLAPLHEFVYLFDLEGRFRYVNRPLLDLWGLTLDEALGKTFSDLGYPPELAQKHEGQIREVIETERSVNGDTAYTSPTGVTGHYEYSFVPLFAEDGSVESVGGHTRVVTEQRRREADLARVVAESERRRRLYETVLSNTPDLQYVWDLNHRFVYANPSLLGMWGKTWDEAIGKHCLELGYEDWHAAMHDREIDQVVATKRPVRGVVPFDGAYGRRMYDYILVPVVGEDGEVEAVAGTTRDVTERIEAEEELRRREELFRTVFEEAPDDAILVMGLERTLSAWNPAAERITGWSASEAIGQPVDLIFTPEDRAQDVPAWETETAARKGKAADERWHVKKDGSRFWANGTTNALHGADGDVRGFLKVFRDATVQHEETRTLAFLSRLTEAVTLERDADDVVTTTARLLAEHLEVSRVAFAEASPEGDRVSVEEEWTTDLPSLVGVHTVEEFGPTVEEDFRAGRIHVSRDAEREYEPGEGLESVRAVHARAGLSVPLLKEGRLAGLLVIHHREPRDWSEAEIALARQVADRLLTEVGRRRAEAALREANGTLEGRVEERTQELTRANRDLNEFSYSVAHDLRAPLRAIVSTSKILLDDMDDRLRDDERILLERQATNGVRLAKIVDDLLGFARLANAPLVRKPLDLTAVARQVAAEVAERGWANPPRIVVAEGLRVEGDPRLLGYALTNLIDNAVKFSPQGGTVTVGTEDGAFFVRDEGVGFDMAHAHKLFVAFERLVDMESFAGTGVGLANVERIVERHGGRIWAESEPGKGATFRFTLG